MSRERASYPRRTYRKAFWAFLRHNHVAVGVLATMFLVLAITQTFVVHGYVLGLLQGSFLTLFVGLVVAQFVAITGSTNQIVGSWGEDNTRDELRSAQRRRLIWGWVDNIEVQGGDVDHLVLLRDGRFVAIDSKWHSVDLTKEVLARDADTALTVARRASLVLRSLKTVTEVTPLVALWGGTHRRLEGAPVTVSGVRIVSGRDLQRWLRAQSRTPIERDAALAQLEALRAFRERVQPPTRPPEPSQAAYDRTPITSPPRHERPSDSAATRSPEPPAARRRGRLRAG